MRLASLRLAGAPVGSASLVSPSATRSRPAKSVGPGPKTFESTNPKVVKATSPAGKQDVPKGSSRGFRRRELLAIDGEVAQPNAGGCEQHVGERGAGDRGTRSPMPPGASPFRARWTLIAGASLIRIIR